MEDEREASGRVGEREGSGNLLIHALARELAEGSIELGQGSATMASDRATRGHYRR